jgi:threonine aldolase
VVEADAHLVNYEAGAGALLAGVQFRTVPGRRGGLLEPADVAAAVRPPGFPLTPTSLVCVEQTTNRGAGAVYSLERWARCER